MLLAQKCQYWSYKNHTEVIYSITGVTTASWTQRQICIICPAPPLWPLLPVKLVSKYEYFESAQLIKFTLHHGPTVQTEMSLTTAGIHCTISQRLSIVRVQQRRMLCLQRCCISTSQRTFGSLWNAAAAHEHRQQYGGRRLGTMAKRQTTLVNERGHIEVDALAHW